MNPDRVLSGALDNSLHTKSVTKHIKQEGDGSGGVDQISYISFYPPGARSQTRTVLSQGSGSQTTTITTETLGVNDADYVRYTAASNTDSLPGAERLSSLYGVWAKRTTNPAQGEQVTFLNESIYGIIPFGNLGSEQHAKLKEMIQQREIYKYTSVERQIENKRPVYVYEMTVKAFDLVSIIQEYQRVTGIGDSSQLDPEDYKSSGNLSVKVTIDILSRQLTKIEYPNGRIEIYNGQNLYKPIDIPNDTIPVEELQRRLQGDEQL